MLRIGVPADGIGWHGGQYYLETVLRALRTQSCKHGISVHVICGLRGPRTMPDAGLLDLADGAIHLGREPDNSAGARTPVVSLEYYSDIQDHIDIIFPVTGDIALGLPHISWIYDFQHLDMPAYFSPAEIAARNRSFNRIRYLGGDVVLSSETMRDRLLHAWPDFRGRTHVLSFSAALTRDVLKPGPESVLGAYGLSGRYVICCNQMWQHKNHATLIKAFDEFCARHPNDTAKLVLTGKISDYRVKGTGFLPYETMAALEAKGRLKLLGFIPRSDQIQLVRRSLALIQPSLYEGWNTGLEEARFLGKAVIASDIPVHREQNLPGARYFAPLSASELAVHLEDILCHSRQSSASQCELAAWQEAENLRSRFAEKLVQTLSSAAQRQAKATAEDAGRANLDRELGSLIWDQANVIGTLKARKLSRRVKGLAKRLVQSVKFRGLFPARKA